MASHGIQFHGGLGGAPAGFMAGGWLANTPEVHKRIDVRWEVYERVNKSVSVSWHVHGFVSTSFDISWYVNSSRAISYADFLEWLADLDVIRCILVEIDTPSGTKYVSNIGYISGPTQDISNTTYPDHLSGAPEITRTIDGNASIGGIELFNGGEYDSWLDEPWVGHEIRIYMGDPTWDRDDFVLVISGINAGISFPSYDTIRFELRDKRELLQEPIQTLTTPYNELMPLSIGDPFNCEPVLEDAPTLRYRYHQNGLATCNPGSVRDNGVAVSFTDQGDGTFILAASPAGRITCDPTGPTTNSAASIVEWMALRSNGIKSADIDVANFSAYPTTPLMSVYTTDQTDILDLIEFVMLSTGGVAIFDRLGYLQLKRLDVPGTSTLTLYEDDIDEFGMLLEEVEQPYVDVTINHSRNWAVQDADSLAGAVSVFNRNLYSTEYQVSTQSNSLSKTDYPIDNVPEPLDTAIDNQVDADAESLRRANLRAVRRKVFRISANARPFAIEIGDTITVRFPRYGFDAGIDCVVIGMRYQLIDNKVQLDVWL